MVDTPLVRDAIDLAKSSSELYLFNHAMRSWLFGVVIAEAVKLAPDPELLAVSIVLHDLGLTDRYSAEQRFEIDGANAARAFMKGGASRHSRYNSSGTLLRSFHSSAQRARGRDDPFWNRCGCDRCGAGSNPAGESARGSHPVPSVGYEKAFQDCLCSIIRRKPATRSLSE